MAEGGTRNVLCRYFINGACREGDRCRFSHNVDSARPSLLCRYYVRGTCAYGQNCRYDHSRVDHGHSSRNHSHTERNRQEPTSSPVVAATPSSDSASVENIEGRSRFGDKTKSQSSQQSKVGLSVSTSGVPCSSESRNMSNNTSESSRQKTLSTPLAGSSLSSSWVNAPEFVPRVAKDSSAKQYEVSYAQVAGAGDKTSESSSNLNSSDSELCPMFLMSGVCQLGEYCTYIHGSMCEVCQLACLHPYDKEQRRIHKEECTRLMEAEMEHSFAVARSRDKVCGICMDTVMERPLASQRRFGILPNCQHCFCLNCIRKWRQSKQFENKIVRSCPECRTQSDYVIPSRYWVDDKDKEEKEKLLVSYRRALSAKPCKYFKEGQGQCPFGNKCFYLHALPDGTKKDVGPPRRRRRFTADGELQSYLENMVLWDFIEEREHRLELLRGSIQTLLLELQLEDLADDFYFADDSVSEASDL
ncbi:probable E3 ubiquitin-protein ligase makorin-1 isoform X1 [Macrobrachium rosenbergii]|uniref:probable E3 ubiquitin-protein ligase makorin-1 isoform X1 n=1 Tax=Macrobrachium rosenbergii TaxID=79674 RepID=UPI0034D5EE28